MTFPTGSLKRSLRRGLLIGIASSLCRLSTTDGFTPLHSLTRAYHNKLSPARAFPPPLKVTSEESEILDDATLLNSVSKDQLADLCGQFGLDQSGNKVQMLARLREHATQQAALEQERLRARVERVQEGVSGDNDKERYEIVSNEEEEDEDHDDTFFYYQEPRGALLDTVVAESAKPKSPTPKAAKTRITNEVITAPPAPLEPNEDGERVVTVYSTSDQNDMTGVAAAQPGQNALTTDALTSAAGQSAGSQPWDHENTKRSETSSAEMDAAKEKITELVQNLLSLTGIPGFAAMNDDLADTSSTYMSPSNYVGFNPGEVPTSLLASASRAIRTARGECLQDVLRDFELHSIGLDGMKGDDVERGGGHYREVSKVRAFLEGFRRAEVRRLARETTSLLLDKLVLEGVEGLDMTLAAMTRAADDTADEGGELNDSLLEYLNDAIREQEKKVNLLEAQVNTAEALSASAQAPDSVDDLWEVTTEDGQRVESIDPSDPKVKRVLQEEYAKMELVNRNPSEEALPVSPSKRLLLLLTLLRDRIKVEAAYAPDEKGRNLRLLAYCLRLTTDEEREQLVMKDLGRSIDRLDSFIELVASSIEYGESTSYQLQPAKKASLNIPQLRQIHELAKEVRNRQARRASGL